MLNGFAALMSKATWHTPGAHCSGASLAASLRLHGGLSLSAATTVAGELVSEGRGTCNHIGSDSGSIAFHGGTAGQLRTELLTVDRGVGRATRPLPP